MDEESLLSRVHPYNREKLKTSYNIDSWPERNDTPKGGVLSSLNDHNIASYGYGLANMGKYPDPSNKGQAMTAGLYSIMVEIGGHLRKRTPESKMTEQKLIMGEKIYAEKVDHVLVTEQQNPSVSILRLWKCTTVDRDHYWDVEGKLNSKELEDNIKAQFFLISPTI